MPELADLDATDVNERGLSSPKALDSFEYAVFAIIDFEAYIQTAPAAAPTLRPLPKVSSIL